MHPFELVRHSTLASAASDVAADPDRALLRAGGIDLMDRLKEGLEAPEQLVELRRVGEASALRQLEVGETVRVGTLVTLAELHEGGLPDAMAALTEAAGQAATPGIRNIATVGGNLLQRPRCWYFRNEELVCLKKGGDLCLAVQGDARYHAILGGGPSYIVHPSSLGAPLVALDAAVEIMAADGKSSSRPIEQLFVSPGEDPSREHRLGPGEILLAVTVPARAGWSSAYEAAREKQSHDWPLAEAAVALRLDGGKIAEARVALGHVAPIPWRSTEAEAVLAGQAPSAALFEQAAKAALEPARPLGNNLYKIPLARGLLRKALHRAGGINLPE